MTGAEPAAVFEKPPSLWRRLRSHRLFMTGAVIFGCVLLLALFADLLQILPPEKMQVRLRFKTPDFAYPLGTDNYGRDIWSRLVHGARLSLSIGFAVALVGVHFTLIKLTAPLFSPQANPQISKNEAKRKAKVQTRGSRISKNFRIKLLWMGRRRLWSR